MSLKLGSKWREQDSDERSRRGVDPKFQSEKGTESNAEFTERKVRAEGGNVWGKVIVFIVSLTFFIYSTN